MSGRSYLVVIIYDIADTKRRNKISRIIKGYGEWVQRSAFECHLTLQKYEKLMCEILPLFDFCFDMLRVYRLSELIDIKTYGRIDVTKDEELIIL